MTQIPMKPVFRLVAVPVPLVALAITAVALAAVFAWATPARSQDAGARSDSPVASQSVPKGWNYEIRNGQRVPKGNRITTSDGSVREELRQGSCLTVKEKSPSGEYKQVTKCD